MGVEMPMFWWKKIAALAGHVKNVEEFEPQPMWLCCTV